MVQSGLSYSRFNKTLILRLSIQGIICIVNIKKARNRVEKSVVSDQILKIHSKQKHFFFLQFIVFDYLHECISLFFLFVCMKPQRAQHLPDKSR